MKRRRFILNNHMSTKNLRNIIKTVLTEETQKKFLNEQWNRLSDPIGYWKILFDNLKKFGIGVKWEVANDPAKSNFMYWGGWVINKDLKKNGGFPITWTDVATKKNYYFKFDLPGSKYAGNAIDKTLLALKGVVGTNFRLSNLGKTDAKTLKTFLDKDRKPKTTTTSGEYPYAQLKNNPTPEFIAKIIRESRGTINDNEAWAEAAFMAIKDMNMYNKVAKALGTDPYKYLRSFINVSTKYHVQAIQVSYLNLLNNNVGTTVTKFSTQCPLTFTEQNPGGGKTNKAGQVPYSLWNTNKDPLLKVDNSFMFGKYRAIVPEDFGWKLNNNIYPYPTLYSKGCTTTTNINESKVYEQANFDRFKSQNQVKLDPMSTTAAGVRKSQNVINQKKMIEFNNALVQQKKLIPQYCQKPLIREKVDKNGGYDPENPQISTAYLSMYTLCKDFGGLWVRGANTANFTCGCRDMSAIELNIAVDDGSGYETKGRTVSGGINKTQTSKNWSDKDNQQLALNVVALASAFIPVVGPAISAGISLAGAYSQYRQGNNKQAAIELFFAVLPFIGKIPGIAKVSRAMAGSLKVKLVRGGTLTLQEYNTLKNVIAYDTYVSTKVGQYLEKQAMSDVSKKLLTTAVKKAEAKVVGLAGTPTYINIKKKAVAGTIDVASEVVNSDVNVSDVKTGFKDV